MLFGQDCAERKLLINISNKEFQRVSGFNAAQFQGSYLKRPVEIVNLKSVRIQPRVVFMLDTSGSMQLGAQIAPGSHIVPGSGNQAVGPFLDTAIRAIPEQVPAMLVSFDEQFRAHTAFTQDRTALREQLAIILGHQRSFKGGTALVASLDEAIERFGSVNRGDSIVLVTDGGDNKSEHFKETLHRIEQSGVRVFVMMLLDPMLITPEEASGPSILKEITDATGGAILPISRGADPRRKDIAAAIPVLVHRLVSRIFDPQELTVRLPEAGKPSDKLKLEFLHRGKETKDLRLEYPQLLPPCTASTSTAAAQP